jgi:excisionase family DNA binding protein
MINEQLRHSSLVVRRQAERAQMSDLSPEHEFLTTEEAAAYLRVSQHTVWRWCKQGRLPAFQIGREWRIRKSGLDELIESLMAEQTREKEPDSIETTDE